MQFLHPHFHAELSKMLPEFLQNTNKRYKTDLSIFIRWLVESGEKCGYEATVSNIELWSGLPETPRVQRGGKGTSGPAAKKPAKRSMCLVHPKDLIPLARAIVGSKDTSIRVTINILGPGLRALAVWKGCASHFAEQTGRSNIDTTFHYIPLLEEVIATLQPRCTFQLGKDNDADLEIETEAAIDDLQNQFNTLVVDDQSENLGPNANASEGCIYAIQSTKKEDVEEGQSFAIYCLFMDLNRLRQYIFNLWSKYNTERLGLITASATTNSAIQIAVQLQNQALGVLPGVTDYQGVLDFLIARYGTRIDDDGTVEVDMDEKEAQWIFVPAHAMLDELCESLGAKTAQASERGHLDVYIPFYDRSSMSDINKTREDVALLTDLLWNLCYMIKYKIPLFAKDELTKGICQMALDRKVPVWLVFAVTVFLDIHHILRKSTVSAFQELQATGGQFVKTLDQYLNLSKGLEKPATWCAYSEPKYCRMKRQIEKDILRDTILHHKVEKNAEFGFKQSDKSEEFFLFKRNPILCGTMVFAILLEQHEMGLAVVKGLETVMYPSHFYNALREKTDPCAPWPLMDEVISIHGENHIFSGAKPTTILDSFKQICICMGYLPKSFRLENQRIEAKPSKKGVRALRIECPIADLFYEYLRMDDSKGIMNLTVQQIESAFGRHALKKDLAGATNSEELCREWEATKTLSISDYLDIFAGYISQELPKLRLDYFEIHRQSVGFLRKLHHNMDEDLENIHGKGYIENESQLPFLGPYVLMAAVGTLKTAEAVGISDAGNKLLEKAGQILNEFVAGLDVSRPDGL